MTGSLMWMRPREVGVKTRSRGSPSLRIIGGRNLICVRWKLVGSTQMLLLTELWLVMLGTLSCPNVLAYRASPIARCPRVVARGSIEHPADAPQDQQRWFDVPWPRST